MHAVAVAFAKHHPHRAVAVASEKANVVWSATGTDQYTTMAQIAHARLGMGDAETAQTILVR